MRWRRTNSLNERMGEVHLCGPSAGALASGSVFDGEEWFGIMRVSLVSRIYRHPDLTRIPEPC